MEVVDEHALLHTDLGGGQADAGGVVHGDDHVVGQRLQAGVDVRHLGAAGAARVTEETDGVSGHRSIVPAATASCPRAPRLSRPPPPRVGQEIIMDDAGDSPVPVRLRCMAWMSVNSARPQGPFSTPIPLHLKPPKGYWGPEPGGR